MLLAEGAELRAQSSKPRAQGLEPGAGSSKLKALSSELGAGRWKKKLKAFFHSMIPFALGEELKWNSMNFSFNLF